MKWMQTTSWNSIQSWVMHLHRVPTEHINMTDKWCVRSVSSRKQCRDWLVCLYSSRRSWARRTLVAPLPSGKPPSEPKESPSIHCYRPMRYVPTDQCILNLCNFSNIVWVATALPACSNWECLKWKVEQKREKDMEWLIITIYTLTNFSNICNYFFTFEMTPLKNFFLVWWVILVRGG